MKFFSKKREELSFEESIGDEWAKDFGVTEAPLDQKILVVLRVFVVLVGLLVVGRVLGLAGNGDFYSSRAEANLSQVENLPAPRGIIKDAKGEILADNRPVFLASLDIREFLKNSELRGKTLEVVRDILNISESDFWELVETNEKEVYSSAIVLSVDLDQDQIIKLKSFNLPTIEITQGFTRNYNEGPAFSSIIGYTGIVSQDDLKLYPDLGGRDWVGKAGLENLYESELRGKNGALIKIRDAKGNILEEKEDKKAVIGKEIKLTINAGLQEYFYKRLSQGLNDLGLKVGVGLAIDTRSGAILALVNVPSFDNNLFNSKSNLVELKKLLASPDRPFFNRVTSGLYAPGSTIKPLHATAALKEGVITPEVEIFSPGYLDVPNPYDPDRPTRFLDWRYQGNVNVYSALAQSSNVYFYVVGGGAPNRERGNSSIGIPPIKGLGINRLNEWWRKFGLGSSTGVDLPGEAVGFLPNIQTHEERNGKSWLLGDTYNVSIGQGDLLVTPIQLLNYIVGISNGGKIYKPFVVSKENSELLYDLSDLNKEIEEVRKGMRLAVESTRGTAHSLNDLPIKVAGKTGSAQVSNNKKENAFFVGFAPYDKPEIAILVLVEDARQGSLNAVPIAKDVFYWYYLNR